MNLVHTEPATLMRDPKIQTKSCLYNLGEPTKC